MKANIYRVHPAADSSKESKQVLKILGELQTALLPPTIVRALAQGKNPLTVLRGAWVPYPHSELIKFPLCQELESRLGYGRPQHDFQGAALSFSTCVNLAQKVLVDLNELYSFLVRGFCVGE
jgi:hypothetical protein